MMPQRLPPAESMPYPERESHFAHRFVRLLTKTAAAMDVGGDGCWLLTLIAMQEDCCRYKRPVLFYNEQLCDLMGGIKKDTFMRIRSRCLDAGWLCYQSRGTRRSGLYFVLIPPHAEGVPDGYVGESIGGTGATNGQPMANKSGGQSASNAGSIGGSMRDSIRPIPPPIPFPGSGVAAVAAGKPATPTTAPVTRVDVINREAATRALMDGVLFRLVGAFGCTVSRETRTEWPRADVTGGQTLHTVATILYWRVCAKDPVQMPSGYSKARASFDALPLDDQRGLAEDCCEYLGVTLPAMRSKPSKSTSSPGASDV